MTGPELSFSALDARRRVERLHRHIHLRTYAPDEKANPRPGEWSLSYWNAATRRVEGYPGEWAMVERLFDLFGRPGAEEL
jgi:hypothetical protein